VQSYSLAPNVPIFLFWFGFIGIGFPYLFYSIIKSIRVALMKLLGLYYYPKEIASRDYSQDSFFLNYPKYTSYGNPASLQFVRPFNFKNLFWRVFQLIFQLIPLIFSEAANSGAKVFLYFLPVWYVISIIILIWRRPYFNVYNFIIDIVLDFLNLLFCLIPILHVNHVSFNEKTLTILGSLEIVLSVLVSISIPLIKFAFCHNRKVHPDLNIIEADSRGEEVELIEKEELEVFKRFGSHNSSLTGKEGLEQVYCVIIFVIPILFFVVGWYFGSIAPIFEAEIQYYP
jgi:hypothetical protein